MNLFALCIENQEYVVKLMPLVEEVRLEIERLFLEQKRSFISQNHVPFSGSWKAEDDELFYITTPQNIAPIIRVVEENIISLDTLDLNSIDSCPIKALFMYDNNNKELLVQKFTKHQVLQKQFALFLDGNTYNRINNKALTLDTKLLCIIDATQIYFNNFSNMRVSFDTMQEFYVVATDVKIDDFFAFHTNLITITNVNNFKKVANQTIRKLIHNLSQETSILNKYTVKEIEKRAKKAKLDSYLNFVDNKIVLPDDKNKLIEALSILDEKLYYGAFTEQAYITNSHRVIVA